MDDLDDRAAIGEIPRRDEPDDHVLLAGADFGPLPSASGDRSRWAWRTAVNAS